MPTRAKNPLHSSALTINDLTIGRQIIVFNLNMGVDLEGTVVSRPYTKFFPKRAFIWPRPQLVVDIRSKSTGEVHAHFLTDIGVVKYPTYIKSMKGYWSLANFTVDHRKRHLLPAAIGFPDDFFDKLAEDADEDTME